MKTLLKRMSAGLLVLFMVVSLLVGVIPADTFAASYTYNTGTRHDYNTSLSSQAIAYYTGNYTWDSLSNLTGGNENCLDTNNPLFNALHDLMADTMTNSVSYSSLPTYWAKTDASKGSSGTIWFYADHTGSGTMSREHVWPKSHASFEEKDGGADLHHLRPSISNVNSTRGNLIMGNVRHLSGYTSKNYVYYKNGICEVADNVKGDVARIFLYVWCRWEEPNLFKNTPNPVIGPNDSKNDGGKVIESLETLLQWCKMDPVDTWEMSRNDQVQNVQGNRNVFIDYPEFAWLVFGQDVPTDLNTPSNNASGGISGKPSDGGNTGGSTGGNTGGSTGGSTTPSANWVSAPQAGTAYKLGLYQENKNKNYYFSGKLHDPAYYLGTTEDINSAADVYLEAVSGGYKIYFNDGSTKKYINVYQSGTHTNTGIESGSTDTVFTWDAAKKAFVTEIGGSQFYLGTYDNYSSIGASAIDKLSGSFTAQLCTTGISTGGNNSGNNGGTTTNPPTTNPPATNPPATQPPATNPPASQPGATEGTQPNTPVTQPSGPAPMATKPLDPNDFYKPAEDNDDNTIVIILAIVAGVAVIAGVVVYFVVLKPKKATAPITEETPTEEPSDDTPTEENE